MWLFWEMTAFVLGSCVRFSSCSPVCVCREECRARVDNGIGMLRLVLLVSTHFAPCSLLLFPLRFFLAVASTRLVLLVTMYFALCSISLVGRPMMLCIMAGTKQRTAWSSLVHVMRQSTEW